MKLRDLLKGTPAHPPMPEWRPLDDDEPDGILPLPCKELSDEEVAEIKARWLATHKSGLATHKSGQVTVLSDEPGHCTAPTLSGKPCKLPAVNGDRCILPSHQRVLPAADA